MKQRLLTFACLALISISGVAATLPKGFVYLDNIDPGIIQEIRYAGFHNFTGRPVTGYKKARCILTKPAAEALKQVQKKLKKRNQSLKVYDCYRPQKAVNDFIKWSKEKNQQQMKAEFYPDVNKSDFFKLGYVAKRSGHTHGSTVDLTIVNLPAKKQPAYKHGQKLASCTAPYHQRFADNSIDMGTGYDCMDKLSHSYNREVSATAIKNRKLLQEIMRKHGFLPYQYEWWHFTLEDQPYPNTFFNFDVS